MKNFFQIDTDFPRWNTNCHTVYILKSFGLGFKLDNQATLSERGLIFFDKQ